MRYSLLFSLIFLAHIILVSAQNTLNSSVYNWEKLQVKKTSSGEVRNIITSSTRSLNMFEVNVFTIGAGKGPMSYQVKEGSDELLILKEGAAEILVNNDRKKLGAGSVVVDSPGDKVTITNTQNSNLVYYCFSFKPYPLNIEVRSDLNSFPLMIDWKKIEYQPAANGGRRSVMQQRTHSLKELEIHVTTLNEGLPSHAAHTHPDEEIILVRKGYVEETIKGKPYRLGPGSVIFLTNDDLHGIGNAGKGQCEYYAIRWLVEEIH